MPRYVAILLWCNKLEIKVYQVTSSEKEMMKFLEEKFGNLDGFELPAEDGGWPGYTTGNLDVVGRYGVRVTKNSTTKQKKFASKWDKEYSVKDVELGCDCSPKRIIIVKTSRKTSIVNVLSEIHNM